MKTTTLRDKLIEIGVDPDSKVGNYCQQITDTLSEFEESKGTLPDANSPQDSESI